MISPPAPRGALALGRVVAPHLRDRAARVSPMRPNNAHSLLYLRAQGDRPHPRSLTPHRSCKALFPPRARASPEGSHCGRFRFRLENSAVPAAPERGFGLFGVPRGAKDRPAGWQTAEQWYESSRTGMRATGNCQGTLIPLAGRFQYQGRYLGESKFLSCILRTRMRSCNPSRWTDASP